MDVVKRVWFTPHTAEKFSVSIESNVTIPAYARLNVESTYPSKGSDGGERHVIILKLLSQRDLVKVRDSITRFLVELEEGEE
jgi:hypothetical protein